MRLAGLLFVCWASLSSCYVIKQGLIHNDLINSRESIADLRADQRYAAYHPRFDLLVQILLYAQQQGLHTWHAYQYFVDIGDRPVSYLVKAAEPFAFQWKTWWFPVVGRVPYLGFFNEQGRAQKAQDLRQQKWDVAEAQVTAFSSLGYFEDPIFSSMLKRTDESFAALIFHELTHRTVWIPGSVAFNENLADFVGDRLAEEFLMHRSDHKGLQRLRQQRRDETALMSWVQGLKDELELYYKASVSQPEPMRKIGKEEIFARHIKTTFPDFESDGFARLKSRSWNNAHLMGLALYRQDQIKIEQVYRCRAFAKIGDFLSAFAAEFERWGSMDVMHERWCA